MELFSAHPSLTYGSISREGHQRSVAHFTIFRVPVWISKKKFLSRADESSRFFLLTVSQKLNKPTQWTSIMLTKVTNSLYHLGAWYVLGPTPGVRNISKKGQHINSEPYGVVFITGTYSRVKLTSVSESTLYCHSGGAWKQLEDIGIWALVPNTVHMVLCISPSNPLY